MKKLQQLGHIDRITVKITTWISKGKAEFQYDVKIRGGDPGGVSWKMKQLSI